MPEVSVLSHLTNSALIVYLLKWLRGTERYRQFAKWMPMAEGKVHVLMSIIGAAATSLGMHGAVTGDYSAGWHIALTIPPLWMILHSAWDVAEQAMLNQVVFAVAVQQKAAAPVVTVPVSTSKPEVTVTAPLADVTGH
jgi:hypothetical protein